MKRAWIALVVSACWRAPAQPTPVAIRATEAPRPEPKASEQQCRRLLAHLVDLEFSNAAARVAPADDQARADLATQKQQVIEAKADEFIDTCRNKTPASRVDCALAAADLDRVARCDAE